MAMALVPQNHLGRIPDELLLEIIKQPCLSVFDLISLARTNRRNYRVAISPAYKAHVGRDYGLAIYWAIKHGRQATMERLIENGVDVDMKEESKGIPLFEEELQMAVYRLRFSKAHSAADQAVDFESVTWATPLAWATFCGQDSAVEYLLDNGADLELPSYGLCGCFHDLVRCSLTFPDPPYFADEDTAEKDVEYDLHQWKPLHYAMCRSNDRTARLLLARGADASDVGGEIPALFVAIRWGRNELVDYLMADGRNDINLVGPDGLTGLHVAHIAERYDLVDKYLDRGADINAAFTAENGPWTIFSIACAEASFLRALQYLRRAADPHFVLKNMFGVTWNQYTVMRLIWQHMIMNADDVERRMQLEQEIMSRGKADHAVNEETN